MKKRHNGYTITPSPKENFPDMVELSRGDLKKKFVSEERAILWIEKQRTEELIDSQKVRVENELYENGIFFYED